MGADSEGYNRNNEKIILTEEAVAYEQKSDHGI